MASEAISEHLNLKIFCESMPPDPPSMCMLAHTPSPPISRTFHKPLLVCVVTSHTLFGHSW